MATVWRLLALVAVVLMPLGMAPAAAGPHQHHEAMPMQHCPDQGSKPTNKSGFVECTMACSAALPAISSEQNQPLPIIAVPAVTTVATLLHGLHPETATPPPRIA